MEIFPVAYFGNISYFQRLVRADRPVFELHEHFLKQTLRSRCRILGSNGVQYLSVPVIRSKGSKTPISEVQVSADQRWRKEHWRSIESAYASAPYFEAYDREIRSILEFESPLLVELNLHITKELLKLIDIELQFDISHEYSSDYDKDHRLNEELTLTGQTPYIQVFGEQFTADLSMLDLLFCEGPLARNFIL